MIYIKKIIDTLKSDNILCGYLYFYIHFVVEIASFYFLSTVTGNSKFVWLVPFIYDGMAFVPQALIGYINDKYPKVIFGLIGVCLFVIAYLVYFGTNISLYLSLIILCLGNAFLHINGAEVTLRASKGKLSHSAIFVAGGSFGVITGRLLAKSIMPFWGVILITLTIIPCVLLAQKFVEDKKSCSEFKYYNKKINPMNIILLATLVVIIRGYMGYGIPTSWNKTTMQTVIFFCIMGFGKALGGILSDSFGIRKIAVLSTVLSIPFLCLGDKVMIISLIGVMFFSMTMAITLGILVSVLKSAPGLAFGFTTIGLFLGTFPIFFVKITNVILNIGMIVVFSLLCTFILLKILDKGENNNGSDI